jgi:hypothetical protein
MDLYSFYKNYLKSSISTLPLLMGAFVVIGAMSAEDLSANTSQSRWSTSPSWAKESESDLAERPIRRSIAERPVKRNLKPFAPGTNNLALGVGQVFLMGDLGGYNDSIGGQLQYTYGVSEIFGFNADLGYSRHSDGQFSQLSLLSGLRTNFAYFDKVTPYAKFGLGFYRQSQQLSQYLSLNPLLFGIHLGPGIDLEISNELYFGANLIFHDIFNSTIQTAAGPRTVGGTYTTFFLHLGTTF